jgi:hypothetical protein
MAGRPKGETTRPGVRITNQFRKRDAMVYDLLCERFHVTITMAVRPNVDGLGEWMTEAFATESAEKPTIGEPGLTRESALRAVEFTWKQKNRAHGFPLLDWNAIAEALRNVRAI